MMRAAFVLVVLALVHGAARADRCIAIKRGTSLSAAPDGAAVGATTARVIAHVAERHGAWYRVRIVDDTNASFETHVLRKATRKARCPAQDLEATLQEIPVMIALRWEDGGSAFDAVASGLISEADNAPHRVIDGDDHACFPHEPVHGVTVHICAPCDALRNADEHSLVKHAICP